MRVKAELTDGVVRERGALNSLSIRARMPIATGNDFGSRAAQLGYFAILGWRAVENLEVFGSGSGKRPVWGRRL